MTPTDNDGESIDKGRLRALIDLHIDAGMDGLTVFGSTGGIGSFSPEERKRVISAAVRHVAGRVPLIAGTSVIAKLAEIDTVAFVKESSGDPARITAVRHLTGHSVTVFNGKDAVAPSASQPAPTAGSPAVATC